MWTLHLFTNTLQISGILKHIFLLKINKSFLLDLIEIKQMKKPLFYYKIDICGTHLREKCEVCQIIFIFYNFYVTLFSIILMVITQDQKNFSQLSILSPS